MENLLVVCGLGIERITCQEKVPGTFRGDRLNGRVRMQDGKDSKESVAL